MAPPPPPPLLLLLLLLCLAGKGAAFSASTSSSSSAGGISQGGAPSSVGAAVGGTERVLWATDLTKTFDGGSRYQFKNIDVLVCKGQKIGLVGVNGCGKSTLCKCLSGYDKADSGTVESPKSTRVVYVPQEPDFPPGSTVLDAIYSSDNPLMATVRRYAEATEALEAGDASPEALTRFEKASTAMDANGGWDATTACDQIMSRLRVRDLRHRPVESLSGGEAKRVSLAAALVQQPDLLILDEPTNHLSVSAIQWLEDLLSDRSLTFLIVTHDRYFLQQTCNEILEMEAGAVYRHIGNYGTYLEAKADRASAANAQLASAQNRLRKELAWVRKQPKARQSKSKKRTEAFHTLSSQVSGAREASAAAAQGVKIDAGSTRLGNTVLGIRDGCLSFDKPLLKDFTYIFERGER
jgi:ATP-binding cassette subfamily F protein uup